MPVLIPLLIIALGSLAQSSSYVPIRKVRQWRWENLWLVQGVFAWLVFPFLGALLAAGGIEALRAMLTTDLPSFIKAMGYGVLWGIGGLTFGLSIRYLGISLGQSLSLGTCAAFGTLIPALMRGDRLLSGDGLLLLAGVGLTLAGIAVIGYAGSLRSKGMSAEEQAKAITEFALKKGLLISLLAGVMSACFSLGLTAGEPIRAAAIAQGVTGLLALNPVILSVTLGGFLTNGAYCLYQNIRNHSGADYFRLPPAVLLSNIALCALIGILWYLQFFGLGMGQSYLQDNPVMLAFAWSILMSLNVLFSNLWGVLLKEWKGATRSTVIVLALGMLLLVLSLVLPNILPHQFSHTTSEEEISTLVEEFSTLVERIPTLVEIISTLVEISSTRVEMAIGNMHGTATKY
jgi:L-rhamnose-H+ transport protein